MVWFLSVCRNVIIYFYFNFIVHQKMTYFRTRFYWKLLFLSVYINMLGFIEIIYEDICNPNVNATISVQGFLIKSKLNANVIAAKDEKRQTFSTNRRWCFFNIRILFRYYDVIKTDIFTFTTYLMKIEHLRNENERHLIDDILHNEVFLMSVRARLHFSASIDGLRSRGFLQLRKWKIAISEVSMVRCVR